MAEVEQFSCKFCEASFGRAEHLRRHETSHSSSRPFKCNYCEASFKRRDVLRKHLTACPGRLEGEKGMPPRLVPGKKLSSCDRCAQSKKACNRSLPCSACISRSQICSYDRHLLPKPPKRSLEATQTNDDELPFDYDFSEDAVLEPSFSPLSLPDMDWLDWQWTTPPISLSDVYQSVSQPQSVLSTSSFSDPSYLVIRHDTVGRSAINEQMFDFLLNFTRNSSLQTVFNYKRPRRSSANCNTTASEKSNFQPNSGDRLDHLQSSLAITSAASDPSDSERMTFVHMVECFEDPLFAQTKMIWDSFRVSRLRSSASVLWSPDAAHADERCLQYFRPSNLRKYVQLYWDEWNPHCPIFHKPTFDILKAPTLVLVPMALIGACLSSNIHEVRQAREWLEFPEELVFSFAILSAEASDRDASDRDASDGNIPSWKIIQAAYLTCLLLNWEGTNTIKRRVRHHRFAAIVSAVREMGLSTANHLAHDYVKFSEFDWHAFIEREETIRTFTFVFLLDTAFVIFNNTPPRMVLHEMDLEMATSEACFQAENATECYEHWQACSSQRLTPSIFKPLVLAEAISALMQPNYDGKSMRFLNMSTLNLFTIIAGLHAIIFQQRSLFICLPTTLLPIRDALKHWQALWNTRVIEPTICERWQDVGFIKHAQEFAWLAMARLNTLERPNQITSNGIDSQPRPDKLSTGLLDDTSMSWVTDLMLSLTIGENEIQPS